MKVQSAAIFGPRLKWARKRLKWSQQRLAGLIDVTRGTIARWETISDIPSAKVMRNLAVALGVNIDFLLGCTDDWRPLVYLNDAELAYLEKIRSLSPAAVLMVRANVDDLVSATRPHKQAAKV